VHFVENNFKIC